MTIKQILKELNDNIEDVYFRFDIGFYLKSGMNGTFLIPTIEISKTGKYLEITIWILSACIHFTLSKEHYS